MNRIRFLSGLRGLKAGRLLLDFGPLFTFPFGRLFGRQRPLARDSNRGEHLSQTHTRRSTVLSQGRLAHGRFSGPVAPFSLHFPTRLPADFIPHSLAASAARLASPAFAPPIAVR